MGFNSGFKGLILSNTTVMDEDEAVKNLATLQWVPRHGGSFPRGKNVGA